ncbi:hypothetical protein MRS44_018320 [Fusarium solani]|uniref:uncharacterized protein n=1 Tax=Fusarium solani TaxID=169388 RepID=UPI0032C44B34|nr:hypothetical protein MRS44_018320 [Fusarium solani]
MDFSFNFGEKVSQCEEIIGYCFNDKVLCAEALNTAGDAKSFYILDGFYRQMPKNGRLAVYGDSIAESYLCSLWVQRELDKHCWTTIRRDLLGNENLARVGKEHGIDNCINANGGTAMASPGMIATTVEAILGAVERDGGRDALSRVMNQLRLVQHALLSSVTLCPYPFIPFLCADRLRVYSLDLLGPIVAALGFPLARGPSSSYAIEQYMPAYSCP